MPIKSRLRLVLLVFVQDSLRGVFPPMSDRERWVVYPLLLLALGMATVTRMEAKTPRPESNVVNATEVRCVRLVCNELAANQAKVAVELDAAKVNTIELLAQHAKVNAELDSATLKTGTLTAGISNATVAKAEAMECKQLDILLQATRGNRASAKEENVRMYANDVRNNLIPLGFARVHWVAPEKSTTKLDSDPAPKATEP